MKGFLVLMGIVLFGAGISWGIFHLDAHFTAKAQAEAEALPRYTDAHYFNALIIVTDTQGLESHRTTTPELLHFSDDTAEAITPYTILQRGEEAPWHLQAEFATLDNASNQAMLHDEVIITRDASPLNEQAHIVTRDLAIDFNTQFAHTEAFTTLQSGTQFTSGTGMHAWFEEPSRIELLSNVKSILTQ